RLMAQPYFALGPRARENAEAFLSDHYAQEGPEMVAQVLASTLTSADAVREAITAYAEAGCDELLLFPCDPDPEQVRLLAESVR
ncbi:LLM class flavin-dependent oxidoreductase, partial [Actinomadura adrarensis]